MLLLAAVTAGVGFAGDDQVGYIDTEIYFPVVDVNIDLRSVYYPFLFLVIAGTANGVNLTDGLDGLAAGTCADLAAHAARDRRDRLDPVGRRRRRAQRRVPRPGDRRPPR